MLLKKLLRILKANSLLHTDDEPVDVEKIFKEYEERAANGYYEQKTDAGKDEHTHDKKNQYGSASKEKKFYDVLEIPQGSEFDEIRLAYKKLMKKYHPDKYPDDEKKRVAAQNLAQQINEAYTYFEKKFGK